MDWNLDGLDVIVLCLARKVDCHCTLNMINHCHILVLYFG